MSLIPFVMPPLHGLRVLVTRPAEQAASLAATIAGHGGEARLFPSIAIEAVAPTQPLTAERYDWIVFLSANAVRHSAAFVHPPSGNKVAAIGHATARALQAASWTVDVIPEAPHTTEMLLQSAEFAIRENDRVLIVRGVGGRDALDHALLERGARPHSLIVYQRVAATYSAAEHEQLASEWQDPGFDIVTATSVETLLHLHEQLAPTARALLQCAPLLVASPRIAHDARALGLSGECVLAPGADDDSLVGALIHWFARAR